MQEVRKRLSGADLRIGNRPLNLNALKAVYEARGNKPVWAGLTPEVRTQVLEVLNKADAEGLDPRVFAVPALDAAADPSAQADADLALTDALLRYAQTMRGQRLDNDDYDDDWHLRPDPFDSRAFLAQALKSGDPVAALRTLAPPYAGYGALRDALAKYRALAANGGWEAIPAGPSLKPGMSDPVRVPAVRRRLIVTGELAPEAAEGPDMDETVVNAIKTFQNRHGLDPDGAVGPRTLVALNTTAQERVVQIATNMERWRWLPRKLEAHHVAVNVAGQTMEVVKDGKVALSMRTIVGDREHHTPAFRSQVVSIVLNPNWRVPSSIATKEILPKLQKDPGYLMANNMRLVGDFPPDSELAYGIGINWKQYKTFPYSIKQLSGDDNALGQLKFNIPNKDDIYLHDTNKPHLFARADRAMSHGCIRLEKPEDLAMHLLEEVKDWDRQKLADTLTKGETKGIILKTPVPVYLLYFTTWVGTDGTIQFREDIYGRDRSLREGLAKYAKNKAVLAQNNTNVH